MVLAPFSTVLLALTSPILSHSAHPVSRAVDRGGAHGGRYYWTLTRKRRMSPSPRIPADRKQDVVTLILIQLKRAQCPLRHVWTASRYLNNIGIKKEQETDVVGHRNVCSNFPPSEAVLGAVAKVAEKGLSLEISQQRPLELHELVLTTQLAGGRSGQRSSPASCNSHHALF